MGLTEKAQQWLTGLPLNQRLNSLNRQTARFGDAIDLEACRR